MKSLAPPDQPHEFKRIYVWELPVRFYHWLNALCILVLTITGFIAIILLGSVGLALALPKPALFPFVKP